MILGCIMADWIECGRSSVQTWECDQMGHMNVQFYVQHAEEAVARFAMVLGLGPSVAREANARLIADQHHMRFHRELRPGAPFYLHVASVYTDGAFVAITAEMRSAVDDQVSYSLTGQYRWVDVTSRAVLDLPETAVARANALRQAMPMTAMERGLSLTPPRKIANVAEANRMGLPVTFRGEVLSEHCDVSGTMRLRDYIGRVSDAVPNLLVRMTGQDRSKLGNRTGGAALEYRLVYREAAKIGDLLSVRSGIKSIGAKAYVWAHWMLNEETGEAIATAEAVAVAMDLDARKAIAVPDDMRAILTPMIVSDLSC